MVRARESGQPLDLLNDLAALRDTLLRADALHAETFWPTGAARLRRRFRCVRLWRIGSARWRPSAPSSRDSGGFS
jgi:hypothetical protein